MTHDELQEEIHAIGGSDAGLCYEASGKFFTAAETAHGFDVIEMSVAKRNVEGLTDYALYMKRVVSSASSLRAAKAAASRRNVTVWKRANAPRRR